MAGVDGSARRSSGSRWKEAIATVFWVGEDAAADNGFIPNVRNAWDGQWQTHYGGVDDPHDRCGYRPCSFAPRENSFYIALPYDDMHDSGTRKSKTSIIPWDQPGATKSLLKNRWVAVRANGKTCYAQWEDVGPFETDDAAYVFGDVAKPKNKRGEQAGIDLSPAVRDCLGVGGVSHVMWRHVEAKHVPPGPWRLSITVRDGPCCYK